MRLQDFGVCALGEELPSQSPQYLHTNEISRFRRFIFPAPTLPLLVRLLIFLLDSSPFAYDRDMTFPFFLRPGNQNHSAQKREKERKKRTKRNQRDRSCPLYNRLAFSSSFPFLPLFRHRQRLYYSFIHPSTDSSIHPSIYACIRPFVGPSDHLSIYSTKYPLID